MQLQRDLVDVEEHLQYARRFYNGAVRDYNDGVQRVPDLLVAKASASPPAEFFQAGDGRAAAPMRRAGAVMRPLLAAALAAGLSARRRGAAGRTHPRLRQRSTCTPTAAWTWWSTSACAPSGNQSAAASIATSPPATGTATATAWCVDFESSASSATAARSRGSPSGSATACASTPATTTSCRCRPSTTYTLRYRTTRQLGFFARHDELYWNAIGPGWAFPIDQAQRRRAAARRRSPVMSAEGYTGTHGARGHGLRSRAIRRAASRWQLTGRWRRSRGLTIVRQLPEGAGRRARRRRSACAGSCTTTAACWWRWPVWWCCWCIACGAGARYGRDPQAGAIIARYEPPTAHSRRAAHAAPMGYDTCASPPTCWRGGRGDLESTKAAAQGDGWRLVRTPAPRPPRWATASARSPPLFAGTTPCARQHQRHARAAAQSRRRPRRMTKAPAGATSQRNGGSLLIGLHPRCQWARRDRRGGRRGVLALVVRRCWALAALHQVRLPGQGADARGAQADGRDRGTAPVPGRGRARRTRSLKARPAHAPNRRWTPVATKRCCPTPSRWRSKHAWTRQVHPRCRRAGGARSLADLVPRSRPDGPMGLASMGARSAARSPADLGVDDPPGSSGGGGGGSSGGGGGGGGGGGR